MSSWKRDMASGLVVLGPILVTLFVVYTIYSFIEGVTPGNLISDNRFQGLTTDPQAQAYLAEVTGVALILALLIVVLYGTGFLVRTAPGSILERAVDAMANRIPGLRVIYNASKTASETALGEHRIENTPVTLETWTGFRMTAFRTGRITDDGKETVFLPTSPNITTGFILEVDPDRLTALDESTEDALTRVVSAGFGESDKKETPPQLQAPEKETHHADTSRTEDEEPSRASSP